MKHLRTVCLLIVLSAATAAVSQGSNAPADKPATPAPQAQASPQPAPTVAGMIERQISASEKQVVEAAEAMPEDKFNFTPESLNIPGSNYKGVRTFALEVKHIATANFLFWCALTGDPMPAGIKGPNGPDELKTKAEIIKFLKDSYAMGHKAAATVTSENFMEQVTFRMGKAPRIYLAMNGPSHANDHYGQMVEYLRMNGIVPPASRTNN
ncbi:MAG TPA: DinB family protein [Candidatus Angelobacter sp.]|nr:DinB family protein [Candidatus Angelobacter sp.]